MSNEEDYMLHVSLAAVEHYEQLPYEKWMTKKEISKKMGISYKASWFKQVMLDLEKTGLLEKRRHFNLKEGRQYNQYKKTVKILDTSRFYLTGYGKRSRKIR